MTPPLEHDYIGLSQAAAAFPATMKLPDQVDPAAAEGDILKETELTLGLPGSGAAHSERRERVSLSLGLTRGPYSSSGAKRVFCDAIDGSGKWASHGRDGSDGESGKGVDLFSPRGNNVAVPGVKDGSGTVAKVAEQDKKEEGSSGAMAPAAKTQVVGWPPIRSYRKNTMAATASKNNDDAEDKQGSGSLYLKVSMDGAPYLRKVDLKIYCNYKELSSSLEKMFTCFTIVQCGSRGMPGKDGNSESRLTDCHGSEYVLTYEDKDGDWMLVGDVPWGMFTDTCKRLRIMKGSEAIGLAPRTAEKCKSRNTLQHP